MAYSGGTGEPNDPYQIVNVADFNQLSIAPNNWNKSFILTADVNLAGLTFTQAPIAPDTSTRDGFQGTQFKGVFDGNGHKIIYFTINGNDYLGLFGQINYGGSVKNIGLESCSVSSSSGSYCIGGLVGCNEGGSISDCYSNGSVNGGSNSQWVGGLVGNNHGGSISDCYSNGSVNGSSSGVGGLVGGNDGSTITACYAVGTVNGSSSDVGGLVGSNDSLVNNCYSTGSVSGTDYVGGLVGHNGGMLTGCYANGSVSGDVIVGGLVGYNNRGMLTGCYATGTATCTVPPGAGNPYNIVGGLVGYNEHGTLISCYANGSVSGDVIVGGLVGSNYIGVLIGCYATGSVSGGWGVGGLVGDNSEGGVLTGCYATGSVTGDANYIGGLVGYVYHSSINGCFWDTQTSGTSDGVGNVNPDPNGAMGRTTAEMMTLSTFTDANGLWDFLGEAANGTDDYWRMCVDGVDYPRLTWEYVQDGDFACPDGVGFDDLQRFGDDWLLTYSTPFYGADANGDKTVNFLDFAILADNWLNP